MKTEKAREEGESKREGEREREREVPENKNFDYENKKMTMQNWVAPLNRLNFPKYNMSNKNYYFIFYYFAFWENSFAHIHYGVSLIQKLLRHFYHSDK